MCTHVISILPQWLIPQKRLRVADGLAFVVQIVRLRQRISNLKTA